MFTKNRQSLPSDAQTKEKLAIYVYEYLLHSGAQKAAQTFLQEIRWDKNISVGDAPGFLHLWWGVFWDIYCAAPERRELFEHSPEAKAYHDYGFVPNPNYMGVAHAGAPGVPHPGGNPMSGEVFRPMFLPGQRLPSPMFPMHGGGPMLWAAAGGPPGPPMMLPGGPHGPPRAFLMRGGAPPPMWISGPPPANMCPPIPPPHSMVLMQPSSPGNAPPQSSPFMMNSNAGPGSGGGPPPGPGGPMPPMNGNPAAFYPPNSQNPPLLPHQQQTSQCFPSSSGTPGPGGVSVIPPSPHDSGVSSQGPSDVYGVPRRCNYFHNGASSSNPTTGTMPPHELMTPMSMSSSDLNALNSAPTGSGGSSSGCFMSASPNPHLHHASSQQPMMPTSGGPGSGPGGGGGGNNGGLSGFSLEGAEPPGGGGYYENENTQPTQFQQQQQSAGAPAFHNSNNQNPNSGGGGGGSGGGSGGYMSDLAHNHNAPTSSGSTMPVLQHQASSSSISLMENSYSSPSTSIGDMAFSDQKDSMAIQKLKESMQEEARIFELSREVMDNGDYFMSQQG